jgi:hypothetical protein
MFFSAFTFGVNQQCVVQKYYLMRYAVAVSFGYQDFLTI